MSIDCDVERKRAKFVIFRKHLKKLCKSNTFTRVHLNIWCIGLDIVKHRFHVAIIQTKVGEKTIPEFAICKNFLDISAETGVKGFTF